jgi:hypothetical protein
MVAIPFVSVLAVFILYTFLVQVHLYTPAIVQVFTVLIVIVAIVRVTYSVKSKREPVDWGDFSQILFVLNLALCIYFGSMLLLHGFDTHDEIYSWNMWALQHVRGEDVDYYYTQAPYPQLFPKLLSYCYMVLGSIEPQTAVKTSLVIFPFTIFTALGLASNRNERKFLIFHVLLCFFLLRNVGLKEIFDKGMPDTMTAAAMLASIFLFLLYRNRRESSELLWLALICAVVAVLCKQPAFVWGLFSLPVLALIDALRQRDSWRRFALCCIPAMCAVVWMLTEGKGFQHNTGVISRSFANRNTLEQLWFSANEYLIHEPSIAVLLVLAVVSVLRIKRGLDILFIFVLPSFVTWFLFASYDMRAGAPSLIVFGYLIAYGNYCLGGRASANNGAIVPVSTGYKIVLAGIALAFACNDAASKIRKEESRHDGYVLGFSQRNNLIGLFGSEAHVVFDQITRNESAKLWTSSNYIYGMFYGQADVTRPAYGNDEYTSKMLLNEITTQGRNYATLTEDLAYGPGNKVLARLVTEECPKLFTPIAGPNNKYHITLYKINIDLLATGYCNL